MEKAFKHIMRTDGVDTLSLSVLYVGHQLCEPCHRWGRGVREHYVLHYIASGKGRYITPCGEYSLTAGDCFIIYPFTEIEYAADSEDPWEYYWVNFADMSGGKSSDTDKLLSRTVFTPDKPVMSGCKSAEIETIMAQMLTFGGNKTAYQAYLTGLTYMLFSYFSELSPECKPTVHESSCYEAAVRYISANYPMNIGIEDIAAAAGVSRTTLYRDFKKYSGVSPVDYLTQCRIEQAKRLLASTDISVAAVAGSVGYEDSLYFSRVFRRMTGITPTEYRRK